MAVRKSAIVEDLQWLSTNCHWYGGQVIATKGGEDSHQHEGGKKTRKKGKNIAVVNKTVTSVKKRRPIPIAVVKPPMPIAVVKVAPCTLGGQPHGAATLRRSLRPPQSWIKVGRQHRTTAISRNGSFAYGETKWSRHVAQIAATVMVNIVGLLKAPSPTSLPSSLPFSSPSPLNSHFPSLPFHLNPSPPGRCRLTYIVGQPSCRSFKHLSILRVFIFSVIIFILYISNFLWVYMPKIYVYI